MHVEDIIRLLCTSLIRRRHPLLLHGGLIVTTLCSGLRNARATYQRLVTIMFKKLLGRMIEVYIDDMVVKSKQKQDHITDLNETFNILRQYKLKLNDSSMHLALIFFWDIS